jgi:3-oxoacyl-[acyl-carrier protein] reductase
MSLDRAPCALVTGGARGLGAAIAARLAADGHFVYVNYLEQHAAADDLVRSIRFAGGEAIAIQADVTSREEVGRLFSEIRRDGHDVRVLVNNAGGRRDSLFALQKSDDWWEAFNHNLAPTVFCCRAALTAMVRNRQGNIINMSSISGLRGVEGQTSYSAAKAAVVGFTKALAREVGRHGVRVNSVAPGMIRTDLTADLDQSTIDRYLAINPLGRLGIADEVAGVVSCSRSSPRN